MTIETDRPIADLLREAVATLEALWDNVFGGDDIDAEPNVYADFDKLIELKRTTRKGLESLSRLSAALATGAAVPPEGWVMVPVELPHEAVSAVLPMYAEMLPDSEFPFTINLWRALLTALAARPAAPPSAAEQPGSAEPVTGVCQTCNGRRWVLHHDRHVYGCPTCSPAPAEAASDAGLVELAAQAIMASGYNPATAHDIARAVLAAILPPIRDAARAEAFEECARFVEHSLEPPWKIAAAIRERGAQETKL